MPADRPDPDLLNPTAATRVCIVEDHASVRTWLTDHLTGPRTEVVGVASGVTEGADMIHTLRPHVAIIDSRLSDGRGIDLCHAISRSLAHVVLILFARSISPHEEREARAAGVSRIVLKNIEGAELRHAVEALSAAPGPAGA